MYLGLGFHNLRALCANRTRLSFVRYFSFKIKDSGTCPERDLGVVQAGVYDCSIQGRCDKREQHRAAALMVLNTGQEHWNRGEVAISRNYFRAALELDPTVRPPQPRI